MRCDGTGAGDGIRVIGEKAEVKGLVVEKCKDGVVLAGTGKHTVEAISSNENTQTGVVVLSDKNRVDSVAATSNGVHGFHLQGHKNKLTRTSSVRTWAN